MCMAQEKTNTLVNRIIFVLSLLGIAMAVYVLQGWLRQSSILCFTGGGCDIVRKSPASYLFGVIPVPAVGLIGYSILAILAFLRTTKLANRYSLIAIRAMLGMATFGVLFVSWFTYTEIFVIKGICTWCVISAVNMIIIFFLTLMSLRDRSDGEAISQKPRSPRPSGSR
ncbi:MAG: hypothetical protein UY16_C0029G0024 [Candidatus Gottesmanbacteria bacterium GW2011_GWA2_47_9]|uniref:Vitamin K epoxide reductase domain-containing protein n=2 Tax=Candidatus Gottesmaniibacteriota TaxID=1752720 RepID=A0A0G1WYT2_9BACT|nr:MAG: hypothetical protein UY16_C0029G0024 [Candidatus Gottesmanbacteria bacterium GW2011_GWA2_47_9]